MMMTKVMTKEMMVVTIKVPTMMIPNYHKEML